MTRLGPVSRLAAVLLALGLAPALTGSCTLQAHKFSNSGGASGAASVTSGPALAGRGGSDASAAGSNPDPGDAGEAGASAADDCTGVLCNSPPASDCTSPAEFRAYDKTGSCSAGKCTYVAQDVSCTCEEHACTTDPCLGLACTTPPDANCKDSETLTQYEPNGACDGGSCSYQATDSKCDFGCSQGQCNPDPCLGVACTTPPANACVDGETFKAYDKVGSCVAGRCSYASQDIACTCKSGACTSDPCIGVTCGSPPATTCKDANTLTKYAASGTCNGGSCSYQATDSGCGANNLCGGAGVCSLCKLETSCGATCAACASGTPKCKDLGATSKCVACLSNMDCSGATPVCNTTTNVCQARPSCVGLAKTCGPSGNADCCASSVVTGDTSNAFKRDNSAALPAKVSTFRLDTYEITVGRFRKFVAAYSQSMTKDGTGANPNNPSDPGWDASWNTTLAANAAALKLQLSCGQDLARWTDAAGANESSAMNCISWLDAAAFCIWDGGRLPTDAEWNYAAAGGIKQRVYPWGSTEPDCSYASYKGLAGEDCQPSPVQVGSLSSKGDGFYGQADLAGNVMEFVQDVSAYPRPATCDNCADLSNDPYAARMVRGGGFSSYPTNLTNDSHEVEKGDVHLSYAGARCARAP